MLRDYLDSFGTALGTGMLGVSGRVGRMVSNVPVDVLEKDDRYVVTATIAGYKKEDVKVSYKDGLLFLSGEMNVENDEEVEGRYIVRERAHSCFNRALMLSGVVEDKISAKMDDGILVVTLPKVEEKEPNSIEIQ